ncbi:MAG: hypothetical protein J0L53_14660 [Spirochaetes bacterium]|nr:hypothetical protein [Spirochaetota bacterium]
MAEKRKDSRYGAGKKPPSGPTGAGRTSADDPRFEDFLKRQFAQLKRELAEHAPFEAAKEGKVISLEERISRPKKSRNTWQLGIAAAVLAAIAVPMVIQLNRQKAEIAYKTEAPAAAGEIVREKDGIKAENKPTAPLQRGNKTTKLDDLEESDGSYYKRAPANTQKKAEASDLRQQGERKLKAVREETSPKDSIATGKVDKPATEAASKTAANAVRVDDADRFAAKKESGRTERLSEESGYAMADEATAPRPAPAAPAAAPTPQLAKSRSAPEISGGDRGAAAAQGEAMPAEAQKNSRSIAIDDAKSRIQKQESAAEEKAEMEKLWKEFERDPKSFNQDKKRSARLRTLLSRHNEKSRAKRMKAVETR